MRVLVCGNRDYRDEDWDVIFSLLSGLECEYGEVYVIQGGAKGADAEAGDWVLCGHRDQAVFYADWDQCGRAAGPIRNKRMLEDGRPDVVLAFTTKPLAETKGTRNMVNQAVEAGLPVYVIEKVQ
jgi:hypothetical protein